MTPIADNDRRDDGHCLLADGSRQHGCYQFSTYRAERRSVTSALWSGGDWHWRLTGPSGQILADCGGYRREADCLAVIQELRANAGAARPPLNL
jgi:uncharacterized protein YegP (UPF0339 family)